MGPAIFGLALLPGLKSFREEFDEEGVEVFVCVGHVSLGRKGSRPTPLEPLPSFG